MGALGQDLRYGLRMLTKNPGFTAVAVVTLALGIGANTAVFSVLNAVLLRPLPYSQPDRLVSVQSLDSRTHAPDNLSYPDFFDFRSRNHVFEHLVTYRDDQFALTGFGEPMHLDGETVTWDLFPLLGVRPTLGSGFLPGEGAAGTPPWAPARSPLGSEPPPRGGRTPNAGNRSHETASPWTHSRHLQP